MKSRPFQQAFLLTLALFLLMNSLGVFLLTYAVTGIHRIEAYSEREQNEKVLVMNSSEFRTLSWIGSRDFVWQGKVFDFDSVSIRNGKVEVTCNEDAKETELKNNLAQNVDQSKSSALLKQAFALLVVAPCDQHQLLFIPSVSSSFANTTLPVGKIAPAAISLNSPPPEIC